VFAHYDIVCDAGFRVLNFYFRAMLRIRGFANRHWCKENILKLIAIYHSNEGITIKYENNIILRVALYGLPITGKIILKETLKICCLGQGKAEDCSESVVIFQIP